MKKILSMTMPVLFLMYSQIVNAQITISAIEKEPEERIISRPPVYDSLENWRYQYDLKDNKRYIGLQVYLPPTPNANKNDLNRDNAFLVSLRMSKIKTGVKSSYRYNAKKNGGGYEIKEHVYDSLWTYVYKPFHYYHHDNNGRQIIYVCSDSSEISDTYYTILDVLYGKRSYSIPREMRNKMSSLEGKVHKNVLVHDLAENARGFMDFNYGAYGEIIYLLKNNRNDDSLYCVDNSHFILVPYFVKQKEMYEGRVLVYDDEKEYGSIKNRPLTMYDSRFIVKYEDENGWERTKEKEVVVEPGSIWTCKEVTLLKPTYKIHYILQNDKGEQFAIKDLEGFIEAKEYAKREADKKLKEQELLAKRKREDDLKQAQQKKSQEKRRLDMIELFGTHSGDLISQGKVQINMTKEMCKYSWGDPLRTHKTTTERGIVENWYYGYGYSLLFVNGVLKRIEE